MLQKTPSPQTTLAILLGASEWPRFPEFQDSKSFANSASRLKAYLLNPQLFGLPPENLLDLFDVDQTADDIDSAIGNFLDQHISKVKAAGKVGRDLLVYYVGHGGFVGSESEYFLAIRRTRSDNPRASGIGIASLAYTLKEKARWLRRLVILDCCFAAAAFPAFQSGSAQVALQQTVDAFKERGEGAGYPERGTALLCSSGPKAPSLISRDDSYTMFTEALLHALSIGNARQQNKPYLTLRELTAIITDLLKDSPEEKGPRPSLHSPDQSDGDVADIPFFPNLAAQVRQSRLFHIHLAAADKTDRGLKRDKNDDCAYRHIEHFDGEDRGLFIVADGLDYLDRIPAGMVDKAINSGVVVGYKRDMFRAGDSASRAAEEISEKLRTFFVPSSEQQTFPLSVNVPPTSLDVENQLIAAVQAAHLAVQRIIAPHHEPGCTITAALILNGSAYIANVGKCRAYLYRPTEGLQKVTHDHSLVNQLIEGGIIEPDEIYKGIATTYTHPQRSEVYRALGVDKKTIEVDVFQINVYPGDILLLCTDGLWDMIRAPEIEQYVLRLRQRSNPQTLCDQLIKRANESGGEDNITAIVIQIKTFLSIVSRV